MANSEQFKIIKEGAEVWNKWRDENDEIKPELLGADLGGADLSEADLREANLSGADLAGADLSDADLSGANLSDADLSHADLSGADLREVDFAGTDLMFAILRGAKFFDANLSYTNLAGADLMEGILRGADLSNADLVEANLSRANLAGANLYGADLSDADLSHADLSGADLGAANLSYADLSEANLIYADLSGADLVEANLHLAKLVGANLNNSDLTKANLTKADLTKVTFVETNLEGADLSNSNIYGISTWNLKTNEKTIQLNLDITPWGEPHITIDNIEVAQFVYLLLNNENIRNVIDTIGKKSVLIIGRFTEECRAILHVIRDELRNRHNLLPIMFEFKPLSTQPTIRTLSTLAHLSRFVIVDFTDAKSILQELTKILDDLPTLPVQPILHERAALPPMADSFLILQSVLEPYIYSNKKKLIEDLPDKVIAPADNWAKKLESKLAKIRQKWLPWQKK